MSTTGLFTVLAFDDYLNLILEAYNAVASKPANTNEGSTLGAITDAAALLALQLEQQLIYDATIARLATSTGADIDSFALPFGITRLGPNASSGPVQLTTNSPVSGSPLIIPVGGIVQTQSGLQFTIVADTDNPDYNAGDNGYPIPVGQQSTQATVVCNTPGSIGNVLANTIVQIFAGPGGTPMPNVNVNNNAPFTNGVDQESDSAFKTRFTLLVSSGRVATLTAIAGVLLSVQTGLTYSLGDQMNADGSAHPAYFTTVVNNAGTGVAPPSSLLTEVFNAINPIRAAGISFQVIAPTLIVVNFAGTPIINPANTNPAAAAAAAWAAAQAYVNNIGLDPSGNPTVCGLGNIYAAMLASPDVIRVDGLTLNGGTGDITAPFAHQLAAGTIP